MFITFPSSDVSNDETKIQCYVGVFTLTFSSFSEKELLY